MGAKSKWLAGDVPAARSILALAVQVGEGCLEGLAEAPGRRCPGPSAKPFPCPWTGADPGGAVCGQGALQADGAQATDTFLPFAATQ